MKRFLSIILSLVLLLSCTWIGVQPVRVHAKTNSSKAIAIVFDNSHSMYKEGNKAWSQATYAMEVFASMLNQGDILLIYPMNRISVNGKDYTMENPLRIDNPSQANIIRDIYTPVNDNGNTHIESVDCAAAGVAQVRADEKYVIVLTDGDVFYENNKNLKDKTVPELDERFAKYASAERIVMYLGVGAQVAMPNTPQSDYFFKEQAVNSQDVLAVLTKMCNRIFGRDSLPSNRISGKNINFDVSMNKLIVFVQGENVSDLKVVDANGKQVGTQESVLSVKYSENKGNAKHPSEPDTSLQGMIITYKDCNAGTYTLEHTGTATSMEVYYEPNADLDFVFTDIAGNTVDPNALYEGDYKVSFGMKDAKTGKLIASDLLGNPKYRGSYYIDGKEYPFTHEGFSGSVDISLKMGEKFQADLTVNYLSGYTISKDSSDFGWPEGGIQVAARPAGELRMEISGGDGTYSLQTLEEGTPYIAKIYYQGTQLTGNELKKVELKWDPETSNANIEQEFADDHFKLKLRHKDPAEPLNTDCGESAVLIYAFYTAEGSSKAQTSQTLNYKIDADIDRLQLQWVVPETYLVIGELESSQAYVINVTLNGAPLTPEEFARLQMKVDCGGINYALTANENASSYEIKLLPTDGIAEGNYPIAVTAQYTDLVGRETNVDDGMHVTLSNTPLWLKWLIAFLLLILLILLIVIIMHIKALPKRVRPDMDGCSLRVGGKDETENANFYAKLSGRQLSAYVEYNADEIARVIINDVTPGKESYISKPSAKRMIYIKNPGSVSVMNDVTAVDISGTGYIVNKSGDLITEDEQQGAYTISNGSIITLNGKTQVAGKEKKFNAEIPLNFKNK